MTTVLVHCPSCGHQVPVALGLTVQAHEHYLTVTVDGPWNSEHRCPQDEK